MKRALATSFGLFCAAATAAEPANTAFLRVADPATTPVSITRSLSKR